MTTPHDIETFTAEGSLFPPPPGFSRAAIATGRLHDEASGRPQEFWAEQARDLLHWHTPFTRTLDWSDPPFARWFHDGTLNVAYNCLDRHVLAGNGDRVALQWEGEPGIPGRSPTRSSPLR